MDAFVTSISVSGGYEEELYRRYHWRSILIKLFWQCAKSLAYVITAIVVLLIFIFSTAFKEPGKFNGGSMERNLIWDKSENEVFTVKNNKKIDAKVTLLPDLLVNTPECKIPEYKLELLSLKKTSTGLYPYKYITNFSGISYLDDGPKLTVNFSLLPSSSSCCYSIISRSKKTSSNPCLSDSEYEIRECLPYYDFTPLPPSAQFLEVHCFEKSNLTTNFDSKEYHVVANVKRKKVPNQLNVMLLGVRGLSRMSMLSSMPKTFSYLNESNWVDLRGLNSVNSLPKDNLFSLLTGYFSDKAQEEPEDRDSALDRHPFIWKFFEEAGYTTAFAEGDPYYSVFNVDNFGFKNAPTNYYLRPFFLYLKSQLDTPFSKKYEPQYHLFMQRILLEYSSYQEGPLFTFFLFNDIKEGAEVADDTYDQSFLTFFQDFAQKGGLKNTFIVFFSDLGSRFGKIRETSIGWYQEKLPFAFIWAPNKSAINNYSTYKKTIQQNSRKLTNFIDIHLTLKQLIGYPGIDSNSNCHSLFYAVSQRRSCGDIGISTKHCACGYTSMEPSPVQKLFRKVIANINTKISKYETDHSTVLRHCPLFDQGRILSTTWYFTKRVCQKAEAIVSMKVQLQPGDLVFVSDLEFSVNKTTLSKTVASLSNKADCTNVPEIQPYCSCAFEKPILIYGEIKSIS